VGATEAWSIEGSELKGPDRIDEAQAPWRRRNERAAATSREHEAGEVPRLSEIALEIALGALRLARTLLTAPLRLAIALLRPREA
jgi:hypothetical protein